MGPPNHLHAMPVPSSPPCRQCPQRKALLPRSRKALLPRRCSVLPLQSSCTVTEASHPLQAGRQTTLSRQVQERGEMVRSTGADRMQAESLSPRAESPFPRAESPFPPSRCMGSDACRSEEEEGSAEAICMSHADLMDVVHGILKLADEPAPLASSS
jgi:hypothetical protein